LVLLLQQLLMVELEEEQLGVVYVIEHCLSLLVVMEQ
jgi:hypothetical protein